jgi:hypothetical protein
MRLGSTTVVMMVLLGSAGDAQTRFGPSIRGVWTMSEKTTAEGTNKAPQPALYIFTNKHYSILQVNGDRPSVNVATATREGLLAVFGPAFGAQAGTYTLAGGQMSVEPTIAKAPAAMTPGTKFQYAVSFEGPLLVLSLAQPRATVQGHQVGVASNAMQRA